MNSLIAAAQFSLSVHKAQGLFDMSERIAVEKLEAALAAAVANSPELHLLSEVNDGCTGILTIVGSEEDGKRLLLHWDRICEIEHE